MSIWGRAAKVAAASATLYFLPAWWCGRSASDWYAGELGVQRDLAKTMIAFEANDDHARADSSANRFAGEWALVTHQMTALGLAQVALAHPELRPDYAPEITKAAAKSFLPEMRDFGTRAWHGEDALQSLASDHGHAYLSYAALAVSMARLVDRDVPPALAREHDRLIAAYVRRLRASSTGLIETYPGEAYPTDVAAVAGAIAVHGKVTGKNYDDVLRHWAANVRTAQIDKTSGLVHQRMDAATGAPHDAPRGSGTALAAYFAGFADESVARQLAAAALSHRSTFVGFGGIREYAAGRSGEGDVDSGPVILGISVSATGFALAPARAFGHKDAFVQLYRTTDLFGMPLRSQGARKFAIGGPIGNALLLALLTSGPEVAR